MSHEDMLSASVSCVKVMYFYSTAEVVKGSIQPFFYKTAKVQGPH